MVIFPSIGGPWCTPPALCLAHMLEAKGVKDTSQLNIREPIGPRDEAVARDLLSNQYKKSADGNLKNMLGLYCRDFDTLLQTVALGYCHVGVTRTNVFKEHETELVLAAAIAACGATRSARVHGKSALNLGNSSKAVRAVYDLAVAINKWNNTEIVAVDVDELVADLAS
ncbi:hypothetical protein E8E14_014647 [Neopestalotiopsis sp. 37M]|nr:hypothetical protein E8E14_014647 [Neopestalotiopsis sp. 37M]